MDFPSQNQQMLLEILWGGLFIWDIFAFSFFLGFLVFLSLPYRAADLLFYFSDFFVLCFFASTPLFCFGFSAFPHFLLFCLSASL